jgi:hypothetical protein
VRSNVIEGSRPTVGVIHAPRVPPQEAFLVSQMIGFIEVDSDEDLAGFHVAISRAEPSNRSGRLGTLCLTDHLRCDLARLRLDLEIEFRRVVARTRTK